MSATTPDADASRNRAGADKARAAGAAGSSRGERFSAAIGAWARHPRTWILVEAFVVRLLWVLLVPSRPVGDFAMYRESAEFLADAGQLDPQFVYMPGYVALLAAVQLLGGGLLAAKMIGVAAGTAIVHAVGGIADTVGGRRAGIIAAAIAAAWPAGIAVSSVTGTDLPSAAVLALAVLALVRLGPRHPWCAAVCAGVLLGLAAWIRAVAAPLAVVSVLYWLASGVRPRRAAALAGVTLVAALLILLPWGVRNRMVYGEFFITDSHGGNTALVGANPNTDGAYGRSLNLMFERATGYRVLETTERHRQSDKVAYQLARRWNAQDRAYAVGLLALKADRLLSHERNLLYWPLFRAGVLDESDRGFFDRHRGVIEFVTDAAWWLIVALFAAGTGICVARRGWPALALLAFPLALTGIYTLFFAEVRYHLAIAPLLFPTAAFALDWVIGGWPHRFTGERRSALYGAAGVVLLFASWTVLLIAGSGLRARHRWAVSLCSYPMEGQTALCSWTRVQPARGPSPVRGVWDGVGLRVRGVLGDDIHASARTVLPLPEGRYRVHARLSATGGDLPPGAVAVAMRVDGRVVARATSPVAQVQSRPVTGGPRAGEGDVPLGGIVDHPKGAMILEIEVEPGSLRSVADGGAVWISQLSVERF